MTRTHRARFILLPLLLLTTLFLSACDIGMRRDIPIEMRRADHVEATPAGKLAAADMSISGPYTHGNLSVFLIHGKGSPSHGNYVTLEEALARKKVVVHETGSVNTLEVENLSDDEVFIHAGEIVKGGQQDRMLASDMILTPKSGRVPIDAFCVEHGRWSQRGDEKSDEFASSGYYVPDKETKLAAKSEGDQGKVWSNVEKAQRKLSANLSADVASPESETSLQLTLENRYVHENAEEYMAALEGIVEGKNDVIGYAFAINGKLNSADAYASGTLFRKLWPALLRSSAVEAIAESEGSTQSAAITREDVRAFLTEAIAGEASARVLNERNRLLTSESEKYIVFETRDTKSDSAWVHRNYLVK